MGTSNVNITQAVYKKYYIFLASSNLSLNCTISHLMCCFELCCLQIFSVKNMCLKDCLQTRLPCSRLNAPKAVSDHPLDKQSRRKTLLFLQRKCFLENKKYQGKKISKNCESAARNGNFSLLFQVNLHPHRRIIYGHCHLCFSTSVKALWWDAKERGGFLSQLH